MEESGRQGGLTFSHSLDGDIEVQERSEGSSIPPRNPPMSDSTEDWSLLGRIQRSPAVGTGTKGRVMKGSGQDKDLGEDNQGNSGKGIQGEAGIRIKKGRYSKKREKKGHRGGRNRRRKQGFPSEDDLMESRDRTGSLPEDEDVTTGCARKILILDPGGAQKPEAGKVDGIRDAPAGREEEEDETAQKRGTTRTREQGRRRRTNVATVVEGRLLRSEKGSKQDGRPPTRCLEYGQGGAGA